MSKSAAIFTLASVEYLRMNLPRIDKCLGMLSEEKVWWTPNGHVNSIGNLILHLSGNVTQWILSGIGGAEDVRERDLEFSTTGGHNKADLYNKIEAVVEQAAEVIRQMDADVLAQKYNIQGFDNTGYGVVIHVIEHFSYHTGQIALMTKLLENQDLGFYADDDLNQLNEDVS
ncbi:MAG: DinB family protein [Bacteroidota bacterium]